jgi:hypothetical protein
VSYIYPQVFSVDLACAIGELSYSDILELFKDIDETMADSEFTNAAYELFGKLRQGDSQ